MAVKHGTNLLEPVGSPLDFVNEIRPIERADEHFWILKMKLFGNIVTDLLGRRGGISTDSDIGKNLLQNAKLAIFRPKVVPPYTDAMGFIDGNKG